MWLQLLYFLIFAHNFKECEAFILKFSCISFSIRGTSECVWPPYLSSKWQELQEVILSKVCIWNSWKLLFAFSGRIFDLKTKGTINNWFNRSVEYFEDSFLKAYIRYGFTPTTTRRLTLNRKFPYPNKRKQLWACWSVSVFKLLLLHKNVKLNSRKQLFCLFVFTYNCSRQTFLWPR